MTSHRRMSCSPAQTPTGAACHPRQAVARVRAPDPHTRNADTCQGLQLRRVVTALASSAVRSRVGYTCMELIAAAQCLGVEPDLLDFVVTANLKEVDDLPRQAWFDPAMMMAPVAPAHACDGQTCGACAVLRLLTQAAS